MLRQRNQSKKYKSKNDDIIKFERSKINFDKSKNDITAHKNILIK